MNQRSILTPVGYQPNYRYPLIIWLHGDGGAERQVHRVAPHISTRNYVFAGVRGVQASDIRGSRFEWPASRRCVAAATDAVFETIDEVCEKHAIHTDRILLAGYQSGATMACRIALKHPDRFAGLVRMSGQFPSGQHVMADLTRLRQRRLPMLWQQAINGSDDDSAELSRDLQLARCLRARLEVRQYVGDDVMNDVALRDIDRWCFDTIICPRPEGSADDASALSLVDTTPLAFSLN
ncbi:MAG: phospholipase [Planctomycetota bacterium]